MNLRELEAAATPAPWHVPPDPENDGHISAAGSLLVDVFGAQNEADAALIAAARNALPLLLDVVDAADLLSKALKAWVLSGLQEKDWPSVQQIGLAYEQKRAALDAAEADR